MQSATQKTISTINPSNGNEIKSYPLMSEDQVSQTIESCHKAFLSWRLQPLTERAEIIKKIGLELDKNKHQLAELMTLEMGKPLSQAIEEVELCVAICEFTAKQGPELLQDEKRRFGDGQTGYVSYCPIGVVYGIQPWNFPAYQVIRYSIANLMAGNGVLLKHASNVTGSAMLLEDIYARADLPAGLFAALYIDHDQSDRVIEHELIRGVTLTGSPDAGRLIAEKAGKNLKKTVMELGSNDAYIVLDDADIKNAVEQCVAGRVYNNGQTCVAAKRFIVVDSVYEQFKEHYVKAMQALTVGDPTSDDTDLGPMAREDLRDKLHDQVMNSVNKGAALLCGGEIPQTDGYYYPATVLENVEPGQPAYDDELFGPAASLIRAKDQDDAFRIANDSDFGLGGAIFTKNTELARELATRYFDTGMVFINGFGVATPEMPFGGVKNSGYGREHGGFGMKEFVNIKSVMVMG